MKVLDSSVLVALLDADDAHHARARRLAEEPLRWRVPSAAMVETLAVCRRLVAAEGRSASVRAIAQRLWGLEGVVEESVFDADAARRLFLRERDLSYADAAIIATAWRHGDDLLTFDKRQERAWRKGPG